VGGGRACRQPAGVVDWLGWLAAALLTCRLSLACNGRTAAPCCMATPTAHACAGITGSQTYWGSALDSATPNLHPSPPAGPGRRASAERLWAAGCGRCGHVTDRVGWAGWVGATGLSGCVWCGEAGLAHGCPQAARPCCFSSAAISGALRGLSMPLPSLRTGQQWDWPNVWCAAPAVTSPGLWPCMTHVAHSLLVKFAASSQTFRFLSVHCRPPNDWIIIDRF